jgi:hypothetical protein
VESELGRGTSVRVLLPAPNPNRRLRRSAKAGANSGHVVLDAAHRWPGGVSRGGWSAVHSLRGSLRQAVVTLIEASAPLPPRSPPTLQSARALFGPCIGAAGPRE